MNKRKNILLPLASAIMLIAWKSGYAQVTDLGSQEVTIISDYQARIEEANKITFVPQSPEAPIPDTNLNYSVPERLIELAYTPAELKPLGVPKEKPPKYRNSYIKLGFGNRITPLAEVVYNESALKNTKVGASFYHLSSIGKRENQRFSDNQANAYVDHYVGMFKISGDFSFNRDVHHFYGYDPDSFSFDAKDVRQRIRSFSGQAGFATAKENKADINFSQDFRFRQSTDIGSIKEWAFVGKTKFAKEIEKVNNLDAHFTFDINHIDFNDTVGYGRDIFDAGIKYTFNNGDWHLSGGVSLVYDDSIFYAFPDLYASKKLFEEKIIFYAGWQRRLEKNTFYSLVTENPFIYNAPFILQNSRVHDRFAGFKGTYKLLSYDLRFSSKTVKNMPLFLNDSMDMKRFDVLYDQSLSMVNVHLGLAVDVNRNLNIGVATDFYIYDSGPNVERPWHLPTFNMNIFGRYNFKDKVLIQADLIAMAGAVAREQDGTIKTIKGVADISLEGEYRFSEYLSLFLQLNNIGSFNYERYLNYPSFGFIGIIGARLSY